MHYETFAAQFHEPLPHKKTFPKMKKVTKLTLALAENFDSSQGFINFLNRLTQEIGSDLANEELKQTLKNLLEPEVPGQNSYVRMSSETDDGSSDDGSAASPSASSAPTAADFKELWLPKLMTLKSRRH